MVAMLSTRVLQMSADPRKVPLPRSLEHTKLRWHMLPDLHLILLLIISWQSSTSGFLLKMGNELDSKITHDSPECHGLAWLTQRSTSLYVLGAESSCSSFPHLLSENPSSFWFVVKVSLHLLTPVSSSISHRENNDMKSYTGANKLKRWTLTTAFLFCLCGHAQ